MLVFQPKTSCVAAEAADVVTIYRSRNALTLPGAPPGLPQVEGFIVALQQETTRHIFGALYLRELKRTLVYAAETFVAGPPGQFRARLQEVVEFFSAHGFDLEEVRLNYGKAMREVVIRGLQTAKSIARCPGLKATVQRQRGPAEQASARREGFGFACWGGAC
jgi:hypothetical protein